MSNIKTNKTPAKGSKRIVGTRARQAVEGTDKSKTLKAKSRQSSKHDQILTLLRRPTGASLDEMQKLSGWQPHSVRGFLSGTVKKKLSLKLSSAKSKDGERRYNVTG